MESSGTLFGALWGCLEGSPGGSGEGPEGRVPGAVAARSEGVPGTLPNILGMGETIRKRNS